MVDRIEGSSWIPGEGGSQVGAQGGARAVWHSTEGDSIAGAVSAYRSHRGWPHATWNPNTGEVAQHLLPGQSARSVENRPGGVETNRYGVVLQIEVVAHAVAPFTNGPLVGLDRIVAWLRANGVPDGWPMGPPLPYPQSYGTNNGNRDAGTWLTRGGHYAHSQVPENDHGDPGAVDITKLAGSTPSLTQRRRKPMFDIVATEDGHEFFFGLGTDRSLYSGHRAPGQKDFVLEGHGGRCSSMPVATANGNRVVAIVAGDGTRPAYTLTWDGQKWSSLESAGGKFFELV